MSTYLTPAELARALSVRDVTDPAQGYHAAQGLLDSVIRALSAAWPSTTVRTVRTTPIVAITDNYDLLGYDPADVTRDARYTRYLSPTTMLRSHTSADIPAVLRGYSTAAEGNSTDALIVLPGLAYRRDVVDRIHVGEPQQVDLWRLRSGTTGAGELREMVAHLADAVLPGARWRMVPARHPYTRGGHQVDVWQGEWLELAECGLIADHVLRGAGLDPARWSGLALGMGMDRALMLRKGIPDIRYLRAEDARIAGQMVDLSPWRPVSTMPPVRRDLSVVIADDTDDETLGDTVRAALGERAGDIESIHVLTRTRYADLPARARTRLAMSPGQVNALVRLVIRPLTHTLTDAEANALRNEVYRAIHIGPVPELA
ncbi:PheS-related mystery ligase SrmL [Nocardia thraciensis]